MWQDVAVIESRHGSLRTLIEEAAAQQAAETRVVCLAAKRRELGLDPDQI